MDDFVKGLFASMETSGDIKGNYLQLEKSTFKDLKDRGLVAPDVNWFHTQRYQPIYDRVADSYLQDIMKTFKIPTVEEAALWSWRPGWYKKYKGDIEAIPNEVKGVYGKSGKEIMLQRQKALLQYLEKNGRTITSKPTATP